MKLSEDYYRNRVVHKTLTKNSDDANNSSLSCGFLYKGKRDLTRKNVCFDHYGGLYVISGSGSYVDARSGKEYPITSGCIVQRMPHVPHHHVYTPDEDWLEFFFCGAEKVFDVLRDMRLVSDEPVFYIGESIEVVNMLSEYLALFERTDDINSTLLLFEFQKLLCGLHDYNNISNKNADFDMAVKALKSNVSVGTSIPELLSECGMSYESFRKKFVKQYGCSPEKYRIKLRINAAKTMLLDMQAPIKQVAYELGYCDEYAFCKQFKEQVGVPPGKFVRSWQNK